MEIKIAWTHIFYDHATLQIINTESGPGEGLKLDGSFHLQRESAIPSPFGAFVDAKQSYEIITNSRGIPVIPRIGLLNSKPDGLYTYEPIGESTDDPAAIHNINHLKTIMQWYNYAALIAPAPFAISDLHSIYMDLYNPDNLDRSNFRKLAAPTVINMHHIGTAKNRRNATLFNPPLDIDRLRFAKRLYIKEMQHGPI